MDNAIRANITNAIIQRGLIIGLFIGGLASFGTMMLLVPQSGKETRTYQE
jgi:gas vesicle protein